jgi:hypothetical protein
MAGKLGNLPPLRASSEPGDHGFMRNLPDDRDLVRFVPRVSLTLIAGFVVFLVSAGLYALPALREPVPPGAIADYRKERVMARLEGKVLWFLAGSMITVTLLSTIPRGTRKSGPGVTHSVSSSGDQGGQADAS